MRHSAWKQKEYHREPSRTTHGSRYKVRRARRAKLHQHVIISATSAPQRLDSKAISSGAIAHNAWQPVHSRKVRRARRAKLHRHVIISATIAPQRLEAKGISSGAIAPQRMAAGTVRRARRAKLHRHVIILATIAPQRLEAKGISSGAVAHSAWQPVQR